MRNKEKKKNKGFKLKTNTIRDLPTPDLIRLLRKMETERDRQAGYIKSPNIKTPPNPAMHNQLRKNVARIKTILRERNPQGVIYE